MGQQRPAARHDAYRVPAGVRVYAKETASHRMSFEFESGLQPARRHAFALKRAARQPVEKKGDRDDCKSRPEAHAHLHARQPSRNLRSKTAGPHQSSQNHHRQGKKDALVEADQERRRGRGNLDLEQDGAWRCPDGLAKLQQVFRHLLEGERGQPEHRRNAVDDRRDDRRNTPETEDHHGRDQINPGRHGLHDVEHGPDGRLDLAVARSEDPERERDQHGDRNRDGHQGNRLHRGFPKTHQKTEPQRDRCEDSRPPVDKEEGENDHDGNQHV